MHTFVTPAPAPAPDREPGSPWPLDLAAEFLAISKRHLMRLVDDGKVRSIKIGSRRFIPDAEVRRVASSGSE